VTRPEVVVFDVNETLSDLTPMGRRFADVGAPELLAKVWFASLLRDGFALTVTGRSGPFAVLARNGLRSVLGGVVPDGDLERAVEYVLEGFAGLPVHDDVPDGVARLRAAGARLVTLTNGSNDVAERLLQRAGVRGHFERLMSVEEAGVWKPARGAYDYAAAACDVAPGAMVLVAVHPWDIHGAAGAGLQTAWLNRAGAPYPDRFAAPDHVVGSLGELADRLAG
jgi:2-haloacid dehalogenase